MLIIKQEYIGGQRLILGDCLKVMPLLGKVDAVVTDPPYFGREDLFPTSAVRAALALISGIPAVIYWPWYGDPPLPDPDAIHIWHKSVPIHPNSTTGNIAGHHYERIFSYGFGGRSRVFRKAAVLPGFAACSDELVKHPTQKPVDLTCELVGLTKATTILDPFMGSGTTLVACQRLGRQGIGIELDPDYFEIACKRVDEAARQPDLFVSQPTPPEQTGFDL